MTGEMLHAAPNPIEINVIRAFGWSLIEYEMTLYQKFLSISVDGSLVTFEHFRNILRTMESKGYLQELTLQGKKAYRKMLVDTELEKQTRPSQPVDEMRLAIGGMKARVREKVKAVTKQPQATAGQKILQALRDWLLEESGLVEIDIAILRECISEIRKAISKSNDFLIETLKCEYPGVRELVEEALKEYGPDALVQDLANVELTMELSS
jgi:hypothetical protein